LASVHGITVDERLDYAVLGDLRQWHQLGALCGACGHREWLNTHSLMKKYGSDQVISALTPGLRCAECNNRSGNRFILGKQPR
jgi:hypothetical protein